MSHPTSEGHAILVPLSIYGHVNPFMQLARRLMGRGLACTLLIEERGRWCLEQILEKSPIEASDLFHVEWVSTPKAEATWEKFQLWRIGSGPFLETLLADRAEGARGPKCIIADQFAGWTSAWAAKLMIKRYFFICSPTIFAYWAYNVSTFVERDRILDRVDENPVLELPGAPEFHLSDGADMLVSGTEMFTASANTYDDAAGHLINSFQDLEVPIIEHFLSQMREAAGRDPKKCEPQWVLPIGPIVSEVRESTASERDSPNDSPCIRWLDSRAPRSVVYIAFGSVHDNDISREQSWELAVALEATKVSFLWILIPRGANDVSHYAEVSTILPPGFQERTKDRGLVYPNFAPQLLVLAHPATGTFITHGGWNSTLESISRGVPLIPWPRAAEQRTCYLLLRSVGIPHVRYGKEGENILVTSAELEKVIRTWIMDGPERTTLERTTLELQRQATTAIAPSGSSYQNFEKFAQEITPL